MPVADRAAGWRKGGRLVGGTACPELVELLAESVVAVTEACGHFLLTAAVHDDGAESFVEAVGVSSGLEEEEAVKGVVHSGATGVRHSSEKSVQKA